MDNTRDLTSLFTTTFSLQICIKSVRVALVSFVGCIMVLAFFHILPYAILYSMHIKTACFCQLLKVKCHASLDQVLWVTFMVCTSIYRPKWIKCQGTVYRLAQFVLSGWQGDDLLQFSKIEELISIQDVAIMIATHYHTVGIDRHYHS